MISRDPYGAGQVYPGAAPLEQITRFGAPMGAAAGLGHTGAPMSATDDETRAAELARLSEENRRLRETCEDMERELTRSRMLLDRAADMVVLHDGQGRIIDANAAAWERTGYLQEEYLLLNIRDLDPAVAAIPLERFGQNWARMVPGQTATVETTQRTKDGRILPLELRITVFEQDDGTRLYVAAGRDVSERREAEEAKVARAAAEESNRAKSQFLASMSHELRTPLNAVIGYAEMLLEDAQDMGQDALVPDLQKIRGAGKHLLGIINDILDLSKVEAGKLELSLEETDLPALVREVESTIRPLAQANRNELVIDLPPDLGHAYTDVTRVRQVLYNLLSNGCKFTEDGAVTLTVRRLRKATGEAIRFQVEDTGIGIDEQHMARLFTPFTQADASTTRRYGGTGLGLSISVRLAEMLGGHLRAQSKPGEGSTFTFELPAEPAPRARSSFPPAPGGDPARPLVLVVDDDASAQDLLARMLEKDGYRVLCAGTGAEALALARAHRPQAITLDVIMPSMDGWAVLGELKADPVLREVPVVLVTMVHERQLAYSLGAADFLNKPVDRSLLLRVLDRYRCDTPPCSVLVVDDDPAMRALSRRALEKDGWRVVEAADGQAAIEHMRQRRPGVVLLDLMMPRLDGFGVLGAMRADPLLREVPVLIVTAADLSEGERAQLAERAAHVMRKEAHDQASLLAQVRARVAACMGDDAPG